MLELSELALAQGQKSRGRGPQEVEPHRCRVPPQAVGSGHRVWRVLDIDWQVQKRDGFSRSVVCQDWKNVQFVLQFLCSIL